MKQFFVKFGMFIALSIFSAAGIASPTLLVVHNNTDAESNAYLSGTPSPMPTAAHATARIPWMLIRLACLSQAKDGLCKAEIKMKTNTTEAIELGMVSVDVDTGDITPKQINANGYTLTVDGPAEITLSESAFRFR